MGGGAYAILKAFNGGEDFPSIDGSNIGFAQWEHKSRSSLLGVNFDFNGDDAIFEIGIVAIVCVLIFFCFCCGCGALHGCTPASKCVRDRRRRRKQERKMKARRKRRMREKEELTEQERRRRKYERRPGEVINKQVCFFTLFLFLFSFLDKKMKTFISK